MLSIKQLRDTDPKVVRRLKKTSIKYGAILLIGIAYLIFILLTDLRIPCILYELTGIKCPGCGITRMLVSFARLDFVSAFKYNPFLFITGPFILLYLAIFEIKYILSGSTGMGKWRLFIWGELILAIAYGVLRNIIPI